MMMKIAILFAAFVSYVSAAGIRPPHSDAVAASRYLVSAATYGVIATCGKFSNKEMKGSVPFSNIASFSDGPGFSFQASTGHIYFYITKFDPSAQDLAVCPEASFTISEEMTRSERKECATIDPENPLCRRITLSGTVTVVKDPHEISVAKEYLFSKHPTMSSWPSDHSWAVYNMNIQRIFLLDFFGGAKIVPVEQYYNYHPKEEGSTSYL